MTFFEKYKRDYIEDHKNDIEQLEKVKKVEDIAQNTTASTYLNKKFHIRMSSIPFDLFLHYIQDNKLLNLSRIVNEHLHIHIVTGKLTPASAGGSSASGGINNYEQFHEISSAQLFPKVRSSLNERIPY